MDRPAAPIQPLRLGALLAETLRNTPAAWRGAGGVLAAWAGLAAVTPWADGVPDTAISVLVVVVGLAALGAVLRIALSETFEEARGRGLGPAGFQFGRPELRLMGAALLCAIFLAMVVSILVLVLLAVFGMAELNAAAIRARDWSAVGPAWKLAVMAIVGMGVLVIPPMLATRLSLFAPATVAQGRMVSLLAMGLSRGSVWPLFLGLAAVALPTLATMLLFAFSGLSGPVGVSVTLGVAILVQAPLTLVLLARAYRCLSSDIVMVIASPGAILPNSEARRAS